MDSGLAAARRPGMTEEACMMRTGAEYLRSLNDGRRVFVDGERVKDVTEHPAFRQAARSIAQPLRHRRRARNARAHDIHLAQDRRAGAARLADPAHACRFARAAAVLGDLGGGDVRPDGAHARSRRRLLLRLCRDAAACSPQAGRNSPTTSSRSTNTCATTTSTRATRSCRRRSTAASPRTSRATRRSTPAWSRSATTAS